MIRAIKITILITLFMSCATQETQSKGNATVEELVKANKNVLFQDETFNYEIDFTSYTNSHITAYNTYNATIESGITFINCTFKKPIKAFKKMNDNIYIATFKANVSFINCTFYDDVNFRGATFINKTDFTKSFFKSNVNFEEANFLLKSHFNGCIFDKETRFQNSFFFQAANFMTTEFNHTVNFQNATFNSDLQFSSSKFYGYTDFSLLDVRGKSYFNYANFFETANFSYATFANDFNFVDTSHKNTDCSNSKFFGKTVIANIEVSENFNLNNCSFFIAKPIINNSKVLIN